MATRPRKRSVNDRADKKLKLPRLELVLAQPKLGGGAFAALDANRHVLCRTAQETQERPTDLRRLAERLQVGLDRGEVRRNEVRLELEPLLLVQVAKLRLGPVLGNQDHADVAIPSQNSVEKLCQHVEGRHRLNDLAVEQDTFNAHNGRNYTQKPCIDQ